MNKLRWDLWKYMTWLEYQTKALSQYTDILNNDIQLTEKQLSDMLDILKPDGESEYAILRKELLDEWTDKKKKVAK